MNAHRFTFPGMIHVSSSDNSRVSVETGTLTADGVLYSVDMILPFSAPDGAQFLCASVQRGAELVWKFQTEGFDGFGRLALAGDIPVVALVNRSSVVTKVIPFPDMTKPGYPLKPRGLRSNLSLKRAAATYLKMECELSDGEKMLLKADFKKEEEARRAVADAELRAKLEKKLTRKLEILSRSTITVSTADNQRRYGLPVTRDEWTCLDDGVYVVLVDGIGEDGTIGIPIESFVVGRQPGREAVKMHARPVKKPEHARAHVAVDKPTPTAKHLFELQGDVFEIDIYPSMDDLRRLRASGLSGIRAGIPAVRDGFFHLLEVTADAINSISETKPINLAA